MSSTALLNEIEFAICPPPDSDENDSNNSYVNLGEVEKLDYQGLTVLVAEFSLLDLAEYKLNYLLIRLADGQLRYLELEWSKLHNQYLIVKNEDWSQDAHSLTFWHLSDAIYWSNTSLQSVYENGKCICLEQIPTDLNITKALSEAIELTEEPAFCSICADYFPTGQTCQHIYFCSGCGRTVSPSNPCDHRQTQQAEPKWAA